MENFETMADETLALNLTVRHCRMLLFALRNFERSYTADYFPNLRG